MEKYNINKNSVRIIPQLWDYVDIPVILRGKIYDGLKPLMNADDGVCSRLLLAEKTGGVEFNERNHNIGYIWFTNMIFANDNDGLEWYLQEPPLTTDLNKGIGEPSKIKNKLLWCPLICPYDQPGYSAWDGCAFIMNDKTLSRFSTLQTQNRLLGLQKINSKSMWK